MNKISMHTMAVGSFVPMLESLSACLDRGEAHAQANKLDLINARLAPDMFTLAQQVQQACRAAMDGISRLTGKGAAAMEDVETTHAGLKAQINRTLAALRGVPEAAFAARKNATARSRFPATWSSR